MMKQTRPSILVIVFLLLMLIGCMRVHTPDVEITKAVLYSPRGEFSFKTVQSQESSLRRTTSAYDGKYGVIINFWPTNDSSGIVVITEKKDTKVEMQPSFYQFNEGEKKELLFNKKYFVISPLSFTDWWHRTHSITDKDNYTRYFLAAMGIATAPSQMSKYSYSGANLKLINHDHSKLYIDDAHLEEIENEWYSYYIAFTINDEPYTINATFKLKIRESIRAGAPGG
jgi:hypothetical protein